MAQRAVGRGRGAPPAGAGRGRGGAPTGAGRGRGGAPGGGAAAAPKGPRFKKQQEEMTLADWIIAKRNGYTGPPPASSSKKAKQQVSDSDSDDEPPPPPRRKPPPPKKKPPPPPPESESESSEEEKENGRLEAPTRDLSDIQNEFNKLDSETKARAKEEAETLLKWATNGKKDDMYKIKTILKL